MESFARGSSQWLDTLVDFQVTSTCWLRFTRSGREESAGCLSVFPEGFVMWRAGGAGGAAGAGWPEIPFPPWQRAGCPSSFSQPLDTRMRPPLKLERDEFGTNWRKLCFSRVSLDLKRLPRWSWLGASCNAYKTRLREQTEGPWSGPERKAGISVTVQLTSRRKISLLGPLLAVRREPSYPSPAWAPRPQAPELEGTQTALGSILFHRPSTETPQWHPGF